MIFRDYSYFGSIGLRHDRTASACGALSEQAACWTDHVTLLDTDWIQHGHTDIVGRAVHAAGSVSGESTLVTAVPGQSEHKACPVGVADANSGR
eukprot:scaffold1594_cov401-Prasinococcus_capsulatus_cf.AAC.57